MFDADGNQNVPHREWVSDFEQAISEVRRALKEEGREEEFIGAKVGGHLITGQLLTDELIDHIHNDPDSLCRGN